MVAGVGVGGVGCDDVADPPEQTARAYPEMITPRTAASAGSRIFTLSSVLVLRKTCSLLDGLPAEREQAEVEEDGQGHAQDHAQHYPEQAPSGNAQQT